MKFYFESRIILTGTMSFFFFFRLIDYCTWKVNELDNYLDPNFWQIDFHGELFPAVHVGVVAFLEGALQLVQLIGRKRSSVPSMFLFTAVVLRRQTRIIGRALVFWTASSNLSVSQIRHAVVRVAATLAYE